MTNGSHLLTFLSENIIIITQNRFLAHIFQGYTITGITTTSDSAGMKDYYYTFSPLTQWFSALFVQRHT